MGGKLRKLAWARNSDYGRRAATSGTRTERGKGLMFQTARVPLATLAKKQTPQAWNPFNPKNASNTRSPKSKNAVRGTWLSALFVASMRRADAPASLLGLGCGWVFPKWRYPFLLKKNRTSLKGPPPKGGPLFSEIL